MASHPDETLLDRKIEINTDRGRIDAKSSRRAAVTAAIFAIGWPGVFVLLLITIGGLASHRDPSWMLLGVLFVLLIGSAITLVAGYAIGGFAHYWFYETKTPPKRMAFAIALIFDGLIFGWFLVMVIRGGQ